MNKLVLDNIVFSLQRAGGISVVWQELLRKIISQESIDYECLELVDSMNNIFRKKINIPASKLKIQEGIISINRYLSPRIKIDVPTIFHSSYYRTVSNKLARNITTVHDFTYELFYNGFRKKIHSWQKFKAIKSSDIVVCISQNTARDLVKFCPSINPQKIRIIYNGVSEEYYPINQADDYSKDSILFVGARSGYKNFNYTVDSIADTNYKLVICGSPLLDSEIKYLNLKLGRARYKYLGRVSNQELNRLYNSVLCLAYPSSYEGFGIPVLEAQRAKCPVIALNSSSIPEVMGDKSFLLNQLSSSEFKEKLRILQKDKRRHEIIEEGYQFSKRFSWNAMSTEYLNLYEELSIK